MLRIYEVCVRSGGDEDKKPLRRYYGGVAIAVKAHFDKAMFGQAQSFPNIGKLFLKVPGPKRNLQL